MMMGMMIRVGGGNDRGDGGVGIDDSDDDGDDEDVDDEDGEGSRRDENDDCGDDDDENCEINDFGVHFIRNFTVDLDAVHHVATTLGLLKLMLNLFCTSCIQGRELC